MSGQQPVTGTERLVARAWSAALGVDAVGVTDNFFDLGGHSVLMHMVREELVRELGRDVTLVDLFRFPTVRAVAAHIDGVGAGPVASGTGRVASGTGRDRLRERRTRRGGVGTAGALR